MAALEAKRARQVRRRANKLQAKAIKIAIKAVNIAITAKQEPVYNFKSIEDYIAAIPDSTIETYKKYWDTIIPITDEEYYNRWMFAFLSVHTSWSTNVRGYNLLMSAPPINAYDGLRSIIANSGVGLINMRSRGMWKFKEDFYKDPQVWKKKPDETWEQFRNRTEDLCFGIGYAKTSFAIELCYPTTCDVTCLDTHMLQLYGTPTTATPSPSKYKTLEQHWVTTCRARNIPPFIARNVYWDKVQSQKDTRYWSYVFETGKSNQQNKVPETTMVLSQQDKVQDSTLVPT